MAHSPSHAKPKKKNYFLRILTVLVIIALLFILASNVNAISEPLKDIPVIGKVISILDFTNSDSELTPSEDEYIPTVSEDPITESVSIHFDSESADSGAPAYVIRDGVSPRRLEFTLYNVYDLDMTTIEEALSKLDFVKDIYRTTVLDDSMRCFTVELKKDVSYVASEYYPDGYIDLTLTETGNDSDDTLYIVRSESGKMNESMASLAESVSDFNPSIVKTQSDMYCVVAGACATEDEAEDILSYLDDDFYIEECSVFSNPE